VPITATLLAGRFLSDEPRRNRSVGLRSCSVARPLAASRWKNSSDEQGSGQSTRRQELKRATRFRTTTSSGRPHSVRRKESNFLSLLRASEAFRDTFGTEVRELNAGAIVSELRRRSHIMRTLSRLRTVSSSLPSSWSQHSRRRHRPNEGHPSGSEDNAIATFQRVASVNQRCHQTCCGTRTSDFRATTART